MADNKIAECVHRIRPIETSDFRRLADLGDKFGSTHDPAKIRAMVCRSGYACMVATQTSDAMVVGAIVYEVTDEYFRISNWFCDLDNEHAAIILRDLIDGMIARLDEFHSTIYAVIAVKNIRLQKFMESMGFRVVKQLPGSKSSVDYRDGVFFSWRLNIPSSQPYRGREGYLR